jgi:hypothetical protein
MRRLENLLSPNLGMDNNAKSKASDRRVRPTLESQAGQGTYRYFCAKVQLLWTCILSAAEDTIVVFPSGHASWLAFCAP